ncbi:PAS domain-containing protein [Natrononativus amylolyticus]|uniref:PAS domain-containing protein n=1 Tax=Natrononativus amylolyticus TaxID=2963434 RepID=UPI0020CEBF5F|nr:PAS domain-containing protein [Natrononativus amylolyticus]
MVDAASILDRAGDPFFALDTDFRFTYLNERAEALLERSRDELVGRVVWDEFPETVETQVADGIYRALDEQIPVSFEVYHTSLETWFEARAFPADGGLSVSLRDVTDRKIRETELARYAAVVESVHDGVVTLDRHARIASVNRALEDVLEIDRDDLVGEHVEALLERAGVPPAETVRVGEAISAVDVGGAASRTVEIPFTTADGDRRVGEVRAVPIERGSATVAALIRDVTARKEYERVVTSLHELTRWLLQADDPEEICAIAVHAGSELLELPISGVWLLEDERGVLEPVAGTASAHDEFGGLPQFSMGEGLVWDVFESGSIERFDDLRDEEGLYNPETPLRSEIIAPIGTHGVLMAGAFEPGAFDDTDVELVSTLVENTQAALERADRERLLGERTARLERQTERLEAVADVLSTDLQRELDAVADALENDTPREWEFPMADRSVLETLDRAERLVDDVREFARTARTVGPRTRIDLEAAVTAAATSSRLDEPTVVVEERARLRADPDRFGHLLEAAFDDAAARANERADVTVQVGLLGVAESDEGARGFVLRDDAAGAGSVAEASDGDVRSTAYEQGLGIALVRAIADAHDWSVTVGRGDRGERRIEIRDVTTLERV